MLILASKSPRRRNLLTQIGVEFEIIPSEYDEDHTISEDPEELALAHAKGKAKEVYIRLKKNTSHVGDVILGVDTLVYIGDEILGKPENKQDAYNMLKKLSGKTHKVMSAMYFIRISDGKEVACLETTQVTFNSLSEEEVDAYLATDEWEDKAGSYAIQGSAQQFVEKIEGSLSSVIGLPIESFEKIYKEIHS